MTSYDSALRTVLETVTTLTPLETVPLVLSAGRVLAEPIVAAENVPAAANSSMDGYAVRASDLAGSTPLHPVHLQIIGESAAGRPFDGEVASGTAVAISTGAVLPAGADAVVEVESTERAGENVAVRREVPAGHAVRAAGEDMRTGEEVLKEGALIGVGEIATLAALGVANVPVRVRPIVGVLSTGEEIVPVHTAPGRGQVRNSNGPALYAAIAAAGAEPIDLGVVGDDPEELAERIEEGLRYDVLITTGGVSVGEHDLVRGALERHGVEVHLHGVAIKPGKPLLFGSHPGDTNGGRGYVFALPGNPVSSLVTFHLFVRPALRQMMGGRNTGTLLASRLGEPLAKNDAKRHFVRGLLGRGEDGEPVVVSTGTQSSGAVSSMGRADCLIVLEEDVRRLERGERVDVMLL